MRARSLSLFSMSLAVLLAGAACGGDDDDDAGDAPDAGSDDGTDDGDAPDAGDDGEVDAGADTVGFDTPEGGTIIHEYIRVGDTLAPALGLPKGETTLYRGIAHFLNGMSPELMTLEPAGQCTNVIDDEQYWLANLGADREYIDVGEVQITSTNDDGETVTITIPRAEAGAPTTYPLDNIGRDHGDGPFYQRLTPGAGDLLSSGTVGDLTLTGSDEFPATTYEDAVYMPALFELENPGLNDPFEMVAGQDFTVGWEEVAQPNAPANAFLVELVALIDPGSGRLVYVCPSAAASANGQFTIPGDAITGYRATVQAQGNNPDQVILLRNTFNHGLVRLNNGEDDNKRRIDVLAVTCYIQLGATSAGD